MEGLREINVGPVGSFVAVSDVHLRHPEEVLAHLLVSEIDGWRNISHAFLLGDIFDFIYVGSRFFRTRWQLVFNALHRLQDRGVKVVFIEGNHDYGFEHFFPPSLTPAIAYAGDCIVSGTHPSLGTISFCHGDDVIYSRKKYLATRKRVKSLAFQRTTSWIPGFVLQTFFNEWATLSRKKGTTNPLTAPHCAQRLREFLTARPLPTPQMLILGHIHEHLDVKIEQTRCLAGPAWIDAPNVLHCSIDGVIGRQFLLGKDIPLFNPSPSM